MLRRLRYDKEVAMNLTAAWTEDSLQRFDPTFWELFCQIPVGIIHLDAGGRLLQVNPHSRRSSAMRPGKNAFFSNNREEGHGTGIGLPMSRQIIEESMGGKLTFTSGPEKTIFRIELPHE